MKPPKDDPLILAFLAAVRGFPPNGEGYLAYFDDEPSDDWRAVLEDLIVPVLGALGYQSDSLERQVSAEGEGCELVARGPSGEPFLIVCVRPAQGRRLHLYRPYFLNSQFKKSGALIGILTDGDGIEVWERRSGMMLKLVELRLTGALRCLEGGGPEAVPDDLWRGLERITYLERGFQEALRFGERPPEPRDACLPQNRTSFLREMGRIAHLVRWDIRARHGGSLGDLSRALPSSGSWGEASPASGGDMPSRILSCFRSWVEGRSDGHPASMLKPYLEELVHFTCARLLVMRYYEERGLLGRLEGLAREGAPSGILYQYERMRRVCPDFFGSGPFDWYLPDEFTARAIRLSLDRHKVAGMGAWEAYDLISAGERRPKGEILGWLVSEAANLASAGPSNPGAPDVPGGCNGMVIDGGDGLAILASAHGLLAKRDPSGQLPAAGGSTRGPGSVRVEGIAIDPGSAAFATLGHLLWAAEAATRGEARRPIGQPVRIDPPPRLRVLTGPDAVARSGSAQDNVESGGPLDLLVADLMSEAALRQGPSWIHEVDRVRPGGVVALLVDASIAPEARVPSISSFVTEDPLDLKLVNFCGLEEMKASGSRAVAILYRKNEQGASEKEGETTPGPRLLRDWAVVGRGGRHGQGPLEATVIRDFRSVQDLVFGSFQSVRVPAASVLDRSTSRLKLDYHPKREAVLDRIVQGSAPLGSLARVFPGIDLQDLEEDIRWSGKEVGSEDSGEARGTVRIIALGTELGRYALNWTGRKWKAVRGDGSPHPLVAGLPSGALGPKILVRVQSRRIMAALDEVGSLPVDAIHGVVPIAMGGEERRALLALLNSEAATLVLRAWSGAPPEAGDRIELQRFLAWFPVRPFALGRVAEIARFVDGIQLCNDTIRKRLAKLGSFAELAKEAWVSFVELREARGLFSSWKIPPVVKGLGPVLREGKTVSAGEELSITCHGEETARYLEEFLKSLYPGVEGKTGVEVEGLIKIPRTEAEIALLLRHAGMIREGIDSFTRRRYDHEKQIDRIVRETYGLEDADLEALREA